MATSPVLALLVKVPWATRRWALPLLVALYRPKDDDWKWGKRHKTPAQLLGQMIRILMRWFPDRTFVVTADGGYATHELAELAAKTPRRLTLASLFYPDATWSSHRRSTPERDALASRERTCPARRPAAEVVGSTSNGRPWKSPGTAGADAGSRR